MKLYVAVVATLVVGCSAVNTDARFHQTLREAGITMQQEEAKALAVAVCMSYKEHPNTPLEAAVLGILEQRPELTPVQAGTFVGAAVGGYCPEYRNRLEIE